MSMVSHHDTADCAHFLPACLCRACHPELNMTDETRRALDEADRRRANAERAEVNRLRAIETTTRKIASMTKHFEPEPDSVSGRILGSLRKKLDRLEAGETA